MNAIQKAAFAASALVTAPMAFARSAPVVAHHACATPSLTPCNKSAPSNV